MAKFDELNLKIEKLKCLKTGENTQNRVFNL